MLRPRIKYLLYHSSINLMLSYACFNNNAAAAITTAPKVLHISANMAQYHYDNGNTVFSNGVFLQDGNSYLKAATVKLNQHPQTHIINNLIAIAHDKQLVHYWTKEAPSKQVSAYAKIIQFYPLAAMLVLKGQVLITEAHNKFTGNQVYYNIKKHTIKVPASNHNSPALLVSSESLP